MSGCLQGRIALVTGAAQGLGEAMAAQLAAAGAHVIRADVKAFGGDADAGGSTIQLDVTSQEQWRAAAAMIERDHGRLDILVNNAGISPASLFENLTLAEWRQVMAVNLDGVFLGCLEMLPLLKKGGRYCAGGASIINISSIAADRGLSHLSAYGASKGGITSLTKHLAIEFARQGYNIRANTIHPTSTLTPLLKQTVKAMSPGANDEEALLAQSAAVNPMGRLGTPDEIATACVFLASDAASFVTGVPLAVDGGAVAG